MTHCSPHALAVIPRVRGTLATLKEANATKQDPLFAVTADNVHAMVGERSGSCWAQHSAC